MQQRSERLRQVYALGPLNPATLHASGRLELRARSQATIDGYPEDTDDLDGTNSQISIH